MSREDGTDLRQFVVDIEGTKTTHPLVGVIDHLILDTDIEVIEALHHQSGSIREHRSLVVVTIGVQRVYLILLPQPSVNLILLLEIRYKVYQNGDRLTWYRPAPYPYRKAALLSLPLPIGKERCIFPEIGTLLFCVITVLPFP